MGTMASFLGRSVELRAPRRATALQLRVSRGQVYALPNQHILQLVRAAHMRIEFQVFARANRDSIRAERPYMGINATFTSRASSEIVWKMAKPESNSKALLQIKQKAPESCECSEPCTCLIWHASSQELLITRCLVARLGNALVKHVL